MVEVAKLIDKPTKSRLEQSFKSDKCHKSDAIGLYEKETSLDIEQ